MNKYLTPTSNLKNEIKRLRAEVKRLREENDELRWFDDFCDICNTTTKTPLHHVNIKGENYCRACLDYTTTNLLAEVKRWKGNWTFLRDWLVRHINNEKTNPTARVFSEFFLQLMDEEE